MDSLESTTNPKMGSYSDPGMQPKPYMLPRVPKLARSGSGKTHPPKAEGNRMQVTWNNYLELEQERLALDRERRIFTAAHEAGASTLLLDRLCDNLAKRSYEFQKAKVNLTRTGGLA